MVLGRIRKDFPPQRQAEAIALLERYPERDRKHGRNPAYKIAVLSEGSVASLSGLIKTALEEVRPAAQTIIRKLCPLPPGNGLLSPFCREGQGM